MTALRFNAGVLVALYAMLVLLQLLLLTVRVAAVAPDVPIFAAAGCRAVRLPGWSLCR
jgi:hypothetical protein